MSMNPEIKAKWLAALRSGEYQQGRGCLRRGSKEFPQFCCLGVLAVIQNGVFDGSDFFLNSNFSAGLTREEQVTLADMNDGASQYYDSGQRSFSQIADYVEENY